MDANGERVPFTIADINKEKEATLSSFKCRCCNGGVESLKNRDSIHDVVGPLGKPSELDGLHKVAVIGGGVGCAIAYPTAKALHEKGAEVHSIVGFRNKDLVILEDEFKSVSNKLII